MTSAGGTSFSLLSLYRAELLSRYQIALPFTVNSKSDILAGYPGLIEPSTQFFGYGNVKSALTDNRDIGIFVERIISDPRTLNRYVFCWAEEWTQSELFDLADKLSKDKINRKLVRIYLQRVYESY